MHLHELFRCQRFRPLQYLACVFVLPHLPFFFIGQRQDT